jgi:hypothetical protein
MRRVALVALCTLFALPAQLPAQESIRDYTRGMEKRDGYFPLYWDAAGGRLLLEIERTGEEFLYLTSLATGIGHTQLGLDRGTIMDEAIARFDRVGQRMLLVFTNPRFRALDADNPALVRSVDESFPISTVAAFDVVAEERGRVLVDATSHFMSDHVGVARRLQDADQGRFSLDRDRSTVYLPRTKAFPLNTEVEVSLTFTSADPGFLVRRQAPDGGALTLRQHHSLVQLPDGDFTPRIGDPRIGNYPVSFFDFAQPLEERYQRSYIVRHRLKKRDPNAAVAEPEEPIVYYLDAGVPEPYRAAFREGAEWWNRVFEAAGFVDAFRVEDMPDDMDPMDARYNVIQWVHRSNAGFSIGPSFVDPRTGEILKAAVRMDSYRSLTDYNLWAGTLPAIGEAEQTAFGDWLASLDSNVSGEEFAMARRRQHTAHEVGHTLGLAHNFIAASYGRASVMDYPAPLIRLVDGEIDLSEAYRDGPGAYDSIAIRYGYTEFTSPEEEAAGLAAIVQEAIDNDIKFLTDGDAAIWGSYPEATRWINGSDAVAELERVMEVRQVLIDRFDDRSVREGEPLVWLNYRFAPVYLHHRYSLEAAIKAVGGMEYHYAVRGELSPPTRIIAPERQRRALEIVLDALEPEQLAVPERVLALMAPRAFGHPTDSWFFSSEAFPAFDQIGTARSLATAIVSVLLEPRRAARLVVLHQRNTDVPSLEEVVARLNERTWGAPPEEEGAALRRVVQRVVVDELIALAGNAGATPEARAGAEWGLRWILEWIQNQSPRLPEEQAHVQLAWADIERFLNRTDDATDPSRARRLPPGTPIGN